ncbi:MAG: phosphotransferase [Phaeodactylibacter sp.]|nr:phosphotransferase [Phaeodactylibacter sp.]
MSVSLQKKVAYLKKPSAYPDNPETIEVKETHHSWVFLGDKYVYKMKKPSRDEYYDYSTIENRRANCREELRLNRRLAEEAYLGVVPLTAGEDGRLHLDGKGEPVDWLVMMKRIPAENMLGRSIEEGTATEEEAARAARRLAEFYAEASPVKIGYPEHRKYLEEKIRESAEILSDAQFGIDLSLVREVAGGLEQYRSEGSALFEARIREQRIVEGHGDLRPEHVCLRPRPLFIDCLEFSKKLRTLDPVYDLSLLSLECSILGAGWIGERFLREYARIAGDRYPEALRYFYTALNALVKARLSAAHLLEEQYRDDEKWAREARAYLQKALENIAFLPCKR